MAAALGVRRHAAAEALAVAPTAAGARVCEAVLVEPADIHLNETKDSRRRHAPAQQGERPSNSTAPT